MTRRSKLTVHSRRLTPTEVAQLWFRRGEDFAREIHDTHADFPQPGPDGLFLLSAVEAWFDHFHGRHQLAAVPDNEGDEAMRAALGRR